MLSDYANSGEDEFFYVLTKEDDHLTMINVRTGFALRLVNVPSNSQNHFNQRLALVSDSTFFTDEGSYFLAKYRLFSSRKSLNSLMRPWYFCLKDVNPQEKSRVSLCIDIS